jgi:hypothetical protein
MLERLSGRVVSLLPAWSRLIFRFTQENNRCLGSTPREAATPLFQGKKTLRELCRIIRQVESGISRDGSKHVLPLFEIAKVFVRLDHVVR